MAKTQLDSELAELHWHHCPDKLTEAETLRRVLHRTGWSQRKLAAAIEWNQPQVSRRLALLTKPFTPRPLERFPGPIGRSQPPPTVARHKIHVLWCAHHLQRLGWLVSMEHPIERGLHHATLRCDLVLSRPGRWRPAWVIEVKRTLPPRWQLNEVFDKLFEYAGRLECEGLLVISHLDGDVPPGPVVPAEVLTDVVGAPRLGTRMSRS